MNGSQLRDCNELIRKVNSLTNELERRNDPRLTELASVFSSAWNQAELENPCDMTFAGYEACKATFNYVETHYFDLYAAMLRE